MVDEFDFEFSPGLSNPYIPPELLEEDEKRFGKGGGREGRGMLFVDDDDDVDERDEGASNDWRPFTQGGYLDVDTDELLGFDEDGEWDMLDEDEFDLSTITEDEIWTSS